MWVRIWKMREHLGEDPSFRMVADEICPNGLLADGGKEVVRTWRLEGVIVLLTPKKALRAFTLFMPTHGSRRKRDTECEHILRYMI